MKNNWVVSFHIVLWIFSYCASYSYTDLLMYYRILIYHSWIRRDNFLTFFFFFLMTICYCLCNLSQAEFSQWRSNIRVSVQVQLDWKFNNRQPMVSNPQISLTAKWGIKENSVPVYTAFITVSQKNKKSKRNLHAWKAICGQCL